MGINIQGNETKDVCLFCSDQYWLVLSEIKLRSPGIWSEIENPAVDTINLSIRLLPSLSIYSALLTQYVMFFLVRQGVPIDSKFGKAPTYR